jgi:endo-1,4-beta-xylanase
MKPDALHGTRGSPNFSTADRLVNWAMQNNYKVRGHTLCWHAQNPTWIRNNNWNRQQALEALKEHITLIVTHFKGKVYQWDVINELWDDNGANPQMRTTNPWFNKIGEDFVDSAFTFAHRADPDARLFYNDYNNSTINNKSTAMYNKIKKMVENGVPIHGIGFQAHHTEPEWSDNFKNSLKQNIKRFNELGLEVVFTETDVRITTPTDQSELIDQARMYKAMLEATLESEGATTFMLWGFTDKHSWIPGTFPGTGDALIFDSNYKKKPAYDSLAAVLKRAQSTAVKQPVKNETLSSMTMSCNGSILKVNFNALNTGKASLKLYTMNGNLVKESVIQTVAGQNYSHNFDISDIANVFFIAKVIDSKNRVYQSKLVASK